MYSPGVVSRPRLSSLVLDRYLANLRSSRPAPASLAPQKNPNRFPGIGLTD